MFSMKIQGFFHVAVVAIQLAECAAAPSQPSTRRGLIKRQYGDANVDPRYSNTNMGVGYGYQNPNPGISYSNTDPGYGNTNLNPGYENPNVNPGNPNTQVYPDYSYINTNPGYSNVPVNPGYSYTNTNPAYQNTDRNPSYSNTNISPGYPNNNNIPNYANPNTNPAYGNPNIIPAGDSMNMAGMDMTAGKIPWWNFVNATTPDATVDGKIGVIIEPDLIPGTIGIDGGQIKKSETLSQSETCLILTTDSPYRSIYSQCSFQLGSTSTTFRDAMLRLLCYGNPSRP